MAEKNRILFVEGADDQHSIWAICEHFKVEETFLVGIPDRTGTINRKAKPTEIGGIDNVFKAVELNLIAGSSSIERLGIVIDADEDIKSRWKKVSAILTKAGYTNLPDSPDSEGTIIKQDFLPAFGVWIMPDNQLRGILEDFLAFLVPANDKTWERAINCIDKIPETERLFKSAYLTKAQIHTFLAWQKEPGKPFGQAITAKYLQAANPNCEKFVNWLKRLFVD